MLLLFWRATHPPMQEAYFSSILSPPSKSALRRIASMLNMMSILNVVFLGLRSHFFSWATQPWTKTHFP